MKNKIADGGSRTGGDVIASIFSVLFGAMMLGQTAPGISAVSVARGAAVEVFETLDRVPPIDSSSEEGLKPDKVDGQVVFHGVGFSYVSDGPSEEMCGCCFECALSPSWGPGMSSSRGKGWNGPALAAAAAAAGSSRCFRSCPYGSSGENATSTSSSRSVSTS